MLCWCILIVLVEMFSLFVIFLFECLFRISWIMLSLCVVSGVLSCVIVCLKLFLVLVLGWCDGVGLVSMGLYVRCWCISVVIYGCIRLSSVMCLGLKCCLLLSDRYSVCVLLSMMLNCILFLMMLCVK